MADKESLEDQHNKQFGEPDMEQEALDEKKRRNEPLPDLDHGPKKPKDGPDDKPDGDAPLPSAVPAAAEPEDEVAPPAPESDSSVQAPLRPQVAARKKNAKARHAERLTEEEPWDYPDHLRRYNPETGVTVASADEQKAIRGVREGVPPRQTSDAEKARKVAKWKEAQEKHNRPDDEDDQGPDTDGPEMYR